MKRLWARLTGRLAGKKKAAPPPRPPLENPYRRFYTSERSFEELARRARERQKDPPKG
ncbi:MULTISPECIES: hypothetical protein [Eubacteriales]|uniref:hypothetical protein n=1 Tax=Eubacteriales TaxID=186802 RepID=UPI0013027BA2|nr:MULTISPECIES: hypothetical protein [Eubacteriales]MDY4168131.1 hypothetical protein [Fournierella sp.]